MEPGRLMMPERSRIVLTGEAAIAAARAKERLWRAAAVAVEPLPPSGRQKKPGGKHGGGKPQVIPKEQEERVLELRAQGLTYHEIMAIFGCSKNSIVSALGRARKRRPEGAEIAPNRL